MTIIPTSDTTIGGEMSLNCVHCKVCDKKFQRLEWLKNKDCDMPEKCGCPEVKKAMQKANQVIEKAKTTTPASWSHDKSVKALPTGCKENEDQIYLTNVEPLIIIEVKKVKR